MKRSKELCCKTCNLITSLEEFIKQGCPNECFSSDSTSKILSKTTNQFSGHCALLDVTNYEIGEMNSSWLGFWLENSHPLKNGRSRVAGLYAMQILEELSDNENDFNEKAEIDNFSSEDESYKESSIKTNDSFDDDSEGNIFVNESETNDTEESNKESSDTESS